jgi:hypothetical protein
LAKTDVLLLDDWAWARLTVPPTQPCWRSSMTLPPKGYHHYQPFADRTPDARIGDATVAPAI